MTKETIAQLAIEYDGAGSFELTQDTGCGETNAVYLDPPHVRRIAELAGFSSTPPDDKAVRTLRALRRLAERVVQFRDCFAQTADFDHADLAYEMTGLNGLRDTAMDALEDLGQRDLVDFLNKPEPVPAPTTPPIVPKAAVAVPGKPAPHCAKAAEGGSDLKSNPLRRAVDAAILKVIEDAPNGITRPALIAALSGQHGRTKIYEGVAELVRAGVVRDSSGILSAQRGRTADGLRTDAPAGAFSLEAN